MKGFYLYSRQVFLSRNIELMTLIIDNTSEGKYKLLGRSLSWPYPFSAADASKWSYLSEGFDFLGRVRKIRCCNSKIPPSMFQAMQ